MLNLEVFNSNEFKSIVIIAESAVLKVKSNLNRMVDNMNMVRYSVRLFDGRVFDCMDPKEFYMKFINNVESIELEGEDYYRCDVKEVEMIKQHILT